MPEGVEQFSATVRGTGGILSTSTTGTVETNNYDNGGVFSDANYPFTLNPAGYIQELNITKTGESIVADITTSAGNELTGVPLNGRTLSIDTIETDSVTFRDPSNTGATTQGFWVGE